MNEKETVEWLEKYKIKNYKILLINDQLVVDAFGNVGLQKKQLKEIPIKFNKVVGCFDCSYNELETLKGCPEEVTDSFFCNDNNLTSLEHSPKKVYYHYFCHNNKLTSLKYCPEKIKGRFIANDNEINSLEFAPKEYKDFWFFGNKIKQNNMEGNIKREDIKLKIRLNKIIWRET